MTRQIIIGGTCLLASLVGVAGTAFWAGGHYMPKPAAVSSAVTAQARDYPLLANRIFIDNPNDTFVNFSDLRKQLNDYVSAHGLSGSLYFEYLPTGTSIKISSDKEEVGASLLKVPAAMELYKASELGRVNLDQLVTLKPEWLDSGFGDLYQKGAGYQLSLRDAAKIMLEDSDNTALKAISYSTANLLEPGEDPSSVEDVSFSLDNRLDILISSASYSSYLKCLYFSCYLNFHDSQELLDYLSHTIYDKRLVAGLPDKHLTVAHKIGNYGQTTQSDCGIFYVPKRNYILCMMIAGPDNPSTDQHFADVSKITYDFVSQK